MISSIRQYTISHQIKANIKIKNSSESALAKLRQQFKKKERKEIIVDFG